ncbi:hypothetical protein ABZW30_15145 [Kitasatospora sp. NPDC004669]|uniref:hypothetical protein n=1 Tax=Kitasatospora sp. NPDC004669 TaxID=3154555 RepID=UPI0033ABD15D
MSTDRADRTPRARSRLLRHEAPTRQARLNAAAWDVVCELHRLRPDLGAHLTMERFAPGLFIGVVSAGPPGYSVQALLSHADGDPVRAAELVASDLP